MMTLSPINRGDNTKQYFLATEYYIGRNGEPRDSCEWNGKGAAALGLTGKPDIGAFENLLEGFGPNGKKLTANAGGKNRSKQGIDCTNSAPKSVSILLAHASPEMRASIMEALQRANAKSIAYLEDNLTIASGHGGERIEKASGIAVATFAHYTSRNLDPQAHFHNVIFAAARREDGTWGGLEQADIMRQQKAAGAIFRSELAAELNGLGFTIEADEKNGFGFTVAGISDEAIEKYSTRRAEVLKYLKKHGLDPSDAAACQRAATRTKSTKNEPAFEDMLKVWEIRGKEFGLNASYIDSIANGKKQEAENSIDYAAIIEEITDKQSAFERKDIIAAIADAASKNGGLPAEKILNLADAFLSKNAYDLGEQVRKADRLDEPQAQQEPLYIGTASADQKHGGRVIKQTTRHLYTTPEVLKREIALYTDFKAAQSDLRHNRSAEEVQAARLAYEAEMSKKIGKPVQMKDEQLACLNHVATSGRQCLIVGFSGTGKSFTMGSVRALEEAAGQRVIATALAGKAASGLRSGATIESKESGTLASIILALEKGQRGEKGGWTAGEEDTFIVDEAGMLGAKQYRRLQELAADSKIIVLGDDKQYQAIEAGNFFGGLQDTAFNFKKAQLTQIERQKLPWHLEAVLNLKEGRGAIALKAFKEHGLLQFKEDEKTALLAMAGDYADLTHNTPENKGQRVAADDKVCMVSKHAQAKIVNDEIRRILIERGELGADSHAVQFTQKRDGQPDIKLDRELRDGDRIRITKNNKKLGAMNGELGIVKQIKRMRGGDHEITMRLDGHKEDITVRLSDFSSLEHGYCATGHASQGVSVSRALTYLDTASINRNAGYVLASRSKQETTLYASMNDAENIEEAFGKLARSISRNGAKDWTLDYLSEAQREAMAKAIEGTPQEFAARVKEIEAQYGAKQPQKQQEQQQEEEKKSEQKKDGALIPASTLAKGTVIAVAAVELAEHDKIIVSEAKTGRKILFDNAGVLAATAPDASGKKQTLAANLQASANAGEISIGEAGKAEAYTAKGRTFKADAGGALAEQGKHSLRPVSGVQSVRQASGRGFGR